MKLNDTQINQWISIRNIAWNLLGEVTGELDNDENNSLCVFKVKHKCMRNIDSLPDHPIILDTNTWCCERGPILKMINVSNSNIDLVISVLDCTTMQAIKWINDQVRKDR